MQPLWADLMSSYSRQVLVRTRLACVLRSARTWSSLVSSSIGIKFDEEKNKVRGEEAVISADDSKVKVVVIPTDEELMIATDTMNLL